MNPFHAGLASVVVALVASVALTACDGTESPDEASRGATPTQPPTGLQLVRDCPSPPSRHKKPTLDDINRLGASIDLPGWQAGDIGASARLRDGRLVWVFGDTLRRGLSPSLVANSMLVTSGRCIDQVLDAEKGPVIPDVSSRVVRWPMSVVDFTHGDHEVVVVMCSRIDRGNQGAFGFTFLGTSAAVFTVEPGEAPRLQRVVDITPNSRDEQQVNWGAAALVDGPWYYVYGTRLTGRDLEFGRELHVARAPLADPGNRQRWRFWDGGRWQPDHRRSAAVLPSQDGVSQTLSVDRYRGQFVAVSKRGGDVADFVYKWTAPSPRGPWTPLQEVKAPGGFDTDKYEYAPLAHPEIELASGKLLVSVSRNTSDLTALAKNPELGRPEFVALPR